MKRRSIILVVGLEKRIVYGVKMYVKGRRIVVGLLGIVWV